MDEWKASAVARRYVAFIKEQHPDIKKVYLFGSCAKGVIGADSDIDLAIIFDMQVQLMKLRRRFDTRIEPHAFRESDFDVSNPLVREILTTGLEVV